MNFVLSLLIEGRDVQNAVLLVLEVVGLYDVWTLSSSNMQLMRMLKPGQIVRPSTAPYFSRACALTEGHFRQKRFD